MFEKSFEARIEEVKTRRKKDEDGGEIYTDVKISLRMNDGYLEELGEEFKALVDSRLTAGAKTVPFTMANLDLSYGELSLYVYNSVSVDKKPQVDFQIDNCEAKSLKLMVAKDDKTKVDLIWVVSMPPMKRAELHTLIEAVDNDLRIALRERQQSLDV